LPWFLPVCRISPNGIDILATDVSTDAIARAKEGSHTQAEIQRGLPAQMLVDYFRPEGREWRLRGSIRNCVQFRVLNLLDPFGALGRFDVIFCRNVLMYFDSETKADILDRLSEVLADDGCLALGAAETMLGLSSRFASESRLRDIITKACHAQLSGAGAIG
jgi:chemotaxis protein methyltransferase CheR